MEPEGTQKLWHLRVTYWISKPTRAQHTPAVVHSHPTNHPLTHTRTQARIRMLSPTRTHTHTHTHTECIIPIAFHSNSDFVNAPQCYFAHTFLLFLIFYGCHWVFCSSGIWRHVIEDCFSNFRDYVMVSSAGVEVPKNKMFRRLYMRPPPGLETARAITHWGVFLSQNNWHHKSSRTYSLPAVHYVSAIQWSVLQHTNIFAFLFV